MSSQGRFLEPHLGTTYTTADMCQGKGPHSSQKQVRQEGLPVASGPSSSLQAAGPGDTWRFLPAPTPHALHTMASRQGLGGTRAYHTHRPTREPVGPAEPEAKRVERQGVDEVHEQMDQALHGHHQQPELQQQTALSHMPESTAAQRVLGHSGGGAGAQSPGEGPDSSQEGTAPTPTLRPSCEGTGEKWAGKADPREACHWPLASCPPCTQLCVPDWWAASP